MGEDRRRGLGDAVLGRRHGADRWARARSRRGPRAARRPSWRPRRGARPRRAARASAAGTSRVGPRSCMTAISASATSRGRAPSRRLPEALDQHARRTAAAARPATRGRAPSPLVGAVVGDLLHQRGRARRSADLDPEPRAQLVAQPRRGVGELESVPSASSRTARVAGREALRACGLARRGQGPTAWANLFTPVQWRTPRTVIRGRQGRAGASAMDNRNEPSTAKQATAPSAQRRRQASCSPWDRRRSRGCRDRRPRRSLATSRHRRRRRRTSTRSSRSTRARLRRLRGRRQAPGLHLAPTPCARRSRRTDIPLDAQAAPRSRSRTERFYEHKGVDYEGVVRAAVKNLKSRQDGAGRLDADDAARPQHLHRRRAQQELQAQDPRGQAGRGARERSRSQGQELDPHQVPELGPLRHGRRPDRGRRRRPPRACSSTSRPARPHAARGRAAGRPAPGALELQPVPRPAGRLRPPRRRAPARWPSWR